MVQTDSIRTGASHAILLTGPTASGKSALSLQLASAQNGVVICMDSMQLYREMDIGTAKPTSEEQKRVPHLLFDSCNIGMRFDVYQYLKLARKTAAECIARGKWPIFCGGTCQYASALAEGLQLIETPTDFACRQYWEEEYRKQGGEALLLRIRSFDPQTANRLAPADRKRIVRALEVYETSNKTLTEIHEESRQQGPERTYHVFAIDLPRSRLYERINQRVLQMLDAGLEEEVHGLIMRYGMEANPLQTAIGYKEWIPYFQGTVTRSEVVDKIQQHSRNYAKRQLSWLRAKPYVHWLSEDSQDCRMQQIFSLL